MEAVMTKMIETLKAAIEAETTILLAALPQAVEPRLSAIRREIEARELLLARLNPSRAPPPLAPQPQTEPQSLLASAALGASKRNCDVERNGIPRHLELRTM